MTCAAAALLLAPLIGSILEPGGATWRAAAPSNRPDPTAEDPAAALRRASDYLVSISTNGAGLPTSTRTPFHWTKPESTAAKA